jgi:hypothetical protein
MAGDQPGTQDQCSAPIEDYFSTMRRGQGQSQAFDRNFPPIGGMRLDSVTACGGEAVLRSGARRYSAAIVMEPIEHSDRKPDMNKRYDF